MDNTFPYTASITREHFMFYEMRATAKLLSDGASDDDAVDRIVQDNLFQYPTEKSVRNVARACVRRLHAMNDSSLIAAIAGQPTEIAKQICLYAMMMQSRLVWEFMLTVIGEKYRTKDSSFGKMDFNSYFMRLQEQDETVATWSDATIAKLRQVIARTLVENEYLDAMHSEHLNPVWLYPILENAIRVSGNLVVLPAFNCFS